MDTDIKAPFMPEVGEEIVRVNNWTAGNSIEFHGREVKIAKVIKRMVTGHWQVEIEHEGKTETHYVRFDPEIVAWVTTIKE